MQLLQLFFEFARSVYALFFVLPLHFHRIAFCAMLRQFFIQFIEAHFGRFVFFFAERLFFDCQLQNFALFLIEFGRLTFDFHLQLTRRFVNQVDGLIRQKAVCNVTVRKYRRGNEGVVADTHTVVHFVLFLQAAQNGDGVFHRRLGAIHLLKAPFQRRIFFDVFAVLVQGGRSDGAKFSARKGGF